MFLEKLEIQGFKSFANKNTLIFPGMLSSSKRGITAIVGPNGSGKSNVADAVRWALGEQSMKTLRGKKSADIIFSGSDKKGSSGMSEVSLYLNNEKRLAPIDYSQIVLTRRLFRNGDSEYLINNSKVRLYDVQMLLAKAKFGQKTYSVIGQGMVEGFLNTTLSERKEFFDEATGVKQFQIKRDESLNKLRASYENLNQAQMLLNEIEPRLRSLTKQVNKLQKRDEIEVELKKLQLKYYAKSWHEINSRFSKFNQQFLELEKIRIEKDKKLSRLTSELSEMEKVENLNVLEEWQAKIIKLQAEKDNLTKQLARLEAQFELQLETNGHIDLSFLAGKTNDLKKEINNINEEIESLDKNIESDEEKGAGLDKEKLELDQAITNINNSLIKKAGEIDNDEVEFLSDSINEAMEKLNQADQEDNLTTIKLILNKIKSNLNKALTIALKFNEQKNLEQLQKKLIKLQEDKEKIQERINNNSFRITARSERVKILKENKEKLIQELTAIQKKLKQNQGKVDIGKNNEQTQIIKQELIEIDNKIKTYQEKINQRRADEEEEKTRLFSLQKELSGLQTEINQLNSELSEIKINSTRYETKLEDLEIEIRQELKSLKEIRQYKNNDYINEAEVQEKINQLKRQLDLIGGIDPEVEKEYSETKQRHDFLSGQVEDLEKAIESLRDIIKELDLTIKERFDKEFKIILDKFEEYFRILFNGGRAKIIKVMEKEMEEEKAESENKQLDPQIDIKKIKFLQKHNATGLAGIEIQACPPSKKIKSINMLSGGERALTAIALICAIISANPSPFVILDEVDAALDEANSERLAKILDDLSHKTQFIVITHNRASMRKANILYGVTMGNDGVSKLLSIKLEKTKNKIKA